MKEPPVFSASCALPNDTEIVKRAHGGGGRAMAALLDSVFRPAFDNPLLARRHDGAAFDIGARCAFTTDSYVVQPLFFPGGDIGTLAVNGTVNDLAMCGARPLYLSAGFILEEGLELRVLRRVVESMREACARAGVQIVTGDVKVIDRGMADGMFINTSGVGRIVAGADIAPDHVRRGDAVIVSADIARHGIAVLNAREKLELEPPIESDCAPIVEPALALIEAGVDVRCLRDLTRGGLADGLIEIAEKARLAITIEESRVPIRDDVMAACELLGLDPLHVATEGCFAAIVAAKDVDRALALLRSHSVSSGARLIGEVCDGPPGQLSSASLVGATRIIEMSSGEQLPRIC